MKPTIKMAAICLSLGLALGCGSKGGSNEVRKPPKKVPQAALKPGEEQSLLPLKVGNQWTYEAESQSPSGSQKAEVTIRVAKVTPSEDGAVAVLETVNADGQVTQVQTWRTNSKGIYQLASGEPGKTATPYTPPQPTIVFPFTAGTTKFSWTGTGICAVGRAGSEKTTARVLSPQEIDTGQGTVSAFPVESGGQFEVSDDKGKKVKGLVATTTYWVPNLGIARFQQQIQIGNSAAIQTLRLKASVLK